MSIFEAGHNFVSGEAALHEVVEFFALNFVLFVVPPELLEVEIEEIV
jgi:hypothetical protein